MIPVFDVRAHDRAIADAIGAAVERVLASGRFILGAEGEQFEARFAAWLGGGHVVGVASGTDALMLALLASGIGAGDEVLTVPNTAVPTANAISAVGATPRFVEVDAATGLLDPRQIAGAVTPRTRAVIPVHLHGRMAPMEEITAIARRQRLVVIEDAAQAHGARRAGRAAGTVGDFGCFSFYPSKNLGAYGDGGAVWTADEREADRLRALRNYGQSDRYRHDSIGINSRLDELQAAILNVKLDHLDRWNAGRRAWAARYRDRLAGSGLQLPAPAADEEHVYHLFAVRVAQREAVRARLQAAGVATQVHYPIPIHLQRAYADLGGQVGAFPAAEAWCRETLSLPCSPALEEGDFEHVVTALGRALAEVSR